MILANYAQQNRNCIREVGMAFTNPFAGFKPTLFPRETTVACPVCDFDLAAWPNGYNTEAAWWQAMKSGGIGSTGNIRSVGTLAGTALAVRLAVAALTGTGTISSATASRIVQLVAALTGTGTVSAANLQAFLAAVAALTGSGTVSAATRTGIGALLAALTASGTAATSTLTGTGELESEIKSYGDLTSEGARDAILSALVDGDYTLLQTLRILVSVAAGKTTVTDLGGGAAEVTFRDLSDTLNRVFAEMTDSERTSVTTDVS